MVSALLLFTLLEFLGNPLSPTSDRGHSRGRRVDVSARLQISDRTSPLRVRSSRKENHVAKNPHPIATGPGRTTPCGYANHVRLVRSVLATTARPLRCHFEAEKLGREVRKGLHVARFFRWGEAAIGCPVSGVDLTAFAVRS